MIVIKVLFEGAIYFHLIRSYDNAISLQFIAKEFQSKFIFPQTGCWHLLPKIIA